MFLSTVFLMSAKLPAQAALGSSSASIFFIT